MFLPSITHIKHIQIAVAYSIQMLPYSYSLRPPYLSQGFPTETRALLSVMYAEKVQSFWGAFICYSWSTVICMMTSILHSCMSLHWMARVVYLEVSKYIFLI